MSRLSVPKNKIRIVLLESIHDSAAKLFTANGYSNVERIAGSLHPRELARLLADAHVVGIRSRTRLTAEAHRRRAQAVLHRLLLHRHQPGRSRRRPSSRAFRSSTRPSPTPARVAELAFGEIIMLLRRIPEKSALAHRGAWRKSASRRPRAARQDARHRRLRPYRLAARRSRRGDGHAGPLLRHRRQAGARQRRGRARSLARTAGASPTSSRCMCRRRPRPAA